MPSGDVVQQGIFAMSTLCSLYPFHTKYVLYVRLRLFMFDHRWPSKVKRNEKSCNLYVTATPRSDYVVTTRFRNTYKAV